MHVNLLWKSNAGSELRSGPGTGIPFPIMKGGISPRLGYSAIRGDQRKRLMEIAFPRADPSISSQLPGSRISGLVRTARYSTKCSFAQVQCGLSFGVPISSAAPSSREQIVPSAPETMPLLPGSAGPVCPDGIGKGNPWRTECARVQPFQVCAVDRTDSTCHSMSRRDFA